MFINPPGWEKNLRAEMKKQDWSDEEIEMSIDEQKEARKKIIQEDAEQER